VAQLLSYISTEKKMIKIAGLKVMQRTTTGYDNNILIKMAKRTIYYF